MSTNIKDVCLREFIFVKLSNFGSAGVLLSIYQGKQQQQSYFVMYSSKMDGLSRIAFLTQIDIFKIVKVLHYNVPDCQE